MIRVGLYGTDPGREAARDDGGWRWLVTLRVGGRTLRYSDADLGDVEWDGRVLAIGRDADLSDLSIADEIAIGAIGTSPRTASVAVYFPADVSAAALARQGIPLAGSPAELALVPSGGTLSDRVPVLSGFLSEPTYGDADEPVLFTIREPEPATDAAYPPPTATVRGTIAYGPNGLPWDEDQSPWGDGDQIAHADVPTNEDVGRCYPRAFGRAGVLVDEDGVEKAWPATPAIATSISWNGGEDEDGAWRADRLLLSLDHAIIGDGESSTGSTFLWVLTPSDKAEGAADPATPGRYWAMYGTVEIGRDFNGVPVTTFDVCDWEDVAGDLYETTQTVQALRYGVSWLYQTPPPVNGSTTPTAGDVLLWLIGLSSLPWDVGRCQVAAEALRGFTLAGAIEERTTPTAWISDHICGTLPCLLASGASGSYVVPIPYGQADTPRIARWTVGDGTIERPRGAVQVETDGRATEATVRWGRELFTGTYLRTATRSAGSLVTTIATATPTTATTTTESAPSSVVQDLPYVWEDGTALRILDWLCWREMRSRRTITLLIDASAWGWVRVGDMIGLTDAGLHLEDVACQVVALPRSTSPWWRVRVMPLDE